MVLRRRASKGPHVSADHLSGTPFKETVHTPTPRTESSGKEPESTSVQVQVTKKQLKFDSSTPPQDVLQRLPAPLLTRRAVYADP